MPKYAAGVLVAPPKPTAEDIERLHAQARAMAAKRGMGGRPCADRYATLLLQGVPGCGHAQALKKRRRAKVRPPWPIGWSLEGVTLWRADPDRDKKPAKHVARNVCYRLDEIVALADGTWDEWEAKRVETEAVNIRAAARAMAVQGDTEVEVDMLVGRTRTLQNRTSRNAARARDLERTEHATDRALQSINLTARHAMMRYEHQWPDLGLTVDDVIPMLDTLDREDGVPMPDGAIAPFVGRPTGDGRRDPVRVEWMTTAEILAVRTQAVATAATVPDLTAAQAASAARAQRWKAAGPRRPRKK